MFVPSHTSMPHCVSKEPGISIANGPKPRKLQESIQEGEKTSQWSIKEKKKGELENFIVGLCTANLRLVNASTLTRAE
jgi:hypothetical protein